VTRSINNDFYIIIPWLVTAPSNCAMDPFTAALIVASIRTEKVLDWHAIRDVPISHGLGGVVVPSACGEYDVPRIDGADEAV
jgi:hypothetical protein